MDESHNHCHQEFKRIRDRSFLTVNSSHPRPRYLDPSLRCLRKLIERCRAEIDVVRLTSLACQPLISIYSHDDKVPSVKSAETTRLNHGQMLTSIHDRNHYAIPIPCRSYLFPTQGIGIRIRPVGIFVVGDVADGTDVVVFSVVTTTCAQARGIVG